MPVCKTISNLKFTGIISFKSKTLNCQSLVVPSISGTSKRVSKYTNWQLEESGKSPIPGFYFAKFKFPIITITDKFQLLSCTVGPKTEICGVLAIHIIFARFRSAPAAQH